MIANSRKSLRVCEISRFCAGQHFWGGYKWKRRKAGKTMEPAMRNHDDFRTCLIASPRLASVVGSVRTPLAIGGVMISCKHTMETVGLRGSEGGRRVSAN
jgi:hypothetical protein